MSTTLNNYKSSGKSDSHYTMYFFDTTVNDVITFLGNKLDFINKSIKDNYKRKMANNIIYQVKCNLESMDENEKFNSFILANENNVNIIKFSPEDIVITKEWKMKNIMFEFSEKYMISYLIDIFSTKMNIMNYHFDNKDFIIKMIGFMKEKILEKSNISNYDDISKNYSSKIIIYSGISSMIDKIRPSYYIKKKNVMNEMIIDYYNDIIEEINIERVKNDIINNINNDKVNHKFLFGKKEISEGIMNMTIRTLYIDENIFKKLCNKLEKSDNLGLLNFEIITFKNSDIIKEYDMMVAEKYY